MNKLDNNSIKEKFQIKIQSYSKNLLKIAKSKILVIAKNLTKSKKFKKTSKLGFLFLK